MFVCVARVTLQIPESGSLKAKRQVLRRITDRVKARFNVSVAEVADNELWQKAQVGLAVVGNDRRHVGEQMDRILHFVDEMYVAPIIAREVETVSFGEDLYGGPAPKDRDEEELAPDAALEAMLLPNDQRSLAEAEGLGAWDRRHDAEPPGVPGRASRGAAGAKKSEKLSLDEARAKARSLRNPRDWEKK